jgi:hypothetical protein
MTPTQGPVSVTVSRPHSGEVLEEGVVETIEEVVALVQDAIERGLNVSAEHGV